MLIVENTTADERAALEEVQKRIQQLQNRIDEAASTIHTAAVQATENISIKNMQMADKELLEQAKNNLTVALKEYSGNYTDDEKLSIQENISRLETAIRQVKATYDALTYQCLCRQTHQLICQCLRRQTV